MKKVLLFFLAIFVFTHSQGQITITLGSALLQDPGTEVHLPVVVKGLDGLTGGTGITATEFHISYSSTSLVYDTTLNFSFLTPSSQWFFSGNGSEYAANWLEPSGNKLNIPDNTMLFEIVFHYLGGATELTFDTARSILLDSAYNIIPGIQFINGQITPSQGSGETRWNGTGSWNTVASWSNGIPGDSSNAIIETGEVTVLSSAICRTITINQGSTVNISSNFSLTANSNYTNNGTLNLKSDSSGTGSLIVRGSVSGTGVNNFGRFLDLSSGSGYHVSSPVSGAKVSVFGSNIAEKYVESSAAWVAMLPSENLEPASGFRISGSAPATVEFQGLFSTSDITKNNLEYTGGSQAEIRGLNLLGNPYPSAIQWEQGNWNRTNLDYAVYVWDGYKYLSWNGSVGALENGIIPAMQGFFVKSNATGASLTIPSGSRLHNTQPFYKTYAEVPGMISMRLELSSDTSHYDEAFVNIFNGSTGGFDRDHDAYKLFGNSAYPQIYTKGTDESMLSINTQPDLASIPVEFRASVSGSYKITFGNIGSFSADQPLFFEDKTAGVSFNIRNLNEYVFTSNGIAESGRFVLHFEEVGIIEHTESAFTAWNTGNVIHISPKTGIGHIDQLDIYSITGQLLFSATDIDLPATVQQERMFNGLYILRMKTDNSAYTQKLIVR